MSLLVYGFDSVCFVAWVIGRRKPKRQPGAYIEPPREQVLSLRRFKGAA
jgi:hypothetical protein